METPKESSDYLKEDAQRTRDILNHIAIGVCVLFMPDDEHQQIEFANTKMMRLINPDMPSPEHADPHKDHLRSNYYNNAFSGVHPDDVEIAKQAFREGYNKDHFSLPLIRLLTNSKRYIWIQLDVTLHEVRPDGRVYYGCYRDMTEEVELKEELEERRRKDMQRTLLNTIGSLPACFAMFRENADGSISVERYSDEYCKLRGCSRENIAEFAKGGIFGAVHPDDRKLLQEAMAESRHDHQLHNLVCRISVKDAGYIWVSINYTHFSLDDSDYLYAVYTDIDQLKRQEQQYEEQYQAAEAFLDSVAAGYLSASRINLSQNTVETIKGTQQVPAAGVLNSYEKSFALFLNSICKDDERRHCALLFSRDALMSDFEQGNTSLSREVQIMISDKGVLWVRIQTTLAKRPASGDIIAFFSVANINDEKLTDAIMRHAVAKQFDFLCCISAVSGNILLFLSNHPHGQMAVMPGMNYNELIKENNTRYVIPGQRSESIEFMSLENVLKALEHSDHVAASFVGEEGHGVRVKQVEFSYLDRENGLIALIRTDITEAQRQQLDQEEKLRSALDAAEKANASKSDFLSRMSHDMRTPLNGIIGMAYLTNEMELPEAARQNIKNIDTSSKFLLSLINDVLDMAKAESGKIELHPEPYDPQAFAQYIESVILPLCKEKNIFLVIDSQPLDNMRIVIDPLRNNQIFFNLLSNAVKFTPEGGTITYRLRQKLLPNQKIALHAEVSDTGIGMSEEFQQHLFEPFVQENRREAARTIGTGLGLSIVKKLVELMGGTISAKSKIGEGTTFYLDAVVDCVAGEQAESQSPKNQPPDNAARLKGKHILVCEDHPLNQEIIRALLQGKGMIVDIVEDGQKGIDQFRALSINYYAAILMDVCMPVMDGIEATRKIRALKRQDARTIPIIAMTANAFAEDVHKCLNAGMNGHIAKPINPEQVFLILGNQIGSVQKR